MCTGPLVGLKHYTNWFSGTIHCVYMCGYVQMCVHMCACMWRPEVHIHVHCLPQPLSTFQITSLTEPGAQSDLSRPIRKPARIPPSPLPQNSDYKCMSMPGFFIVFSYIRI